MNTLQYEILVEILVTKVGQPVRETVVHCERIKQLKDQIKGVETKQDTRQKDNCDVNVVIKNLPDNAGEDLDSVVNGLFIDGLQLREVAITKTRRLASRTANKPGIVIASLQTQEMRTKVLRAKKSLKDSRNQVFRKVYIDADKPHAIRNMEANFRTLMKGMNNDNMIMRGNRLTLGEPTRSVVAIFPLETQSGVIYPLISLNTCHLSCIYMKMRQISYYAVVILTLDVVIYMNVKYPEIS